MQTEARPRARASFRGDEGTDCHLRGDAYHLEFANSVGAARGGGKCRSPVRGEQCGNLPPGEQPSSVGSFIRGNSGEYPGSRRHSGKSRAGDWTSGLRASNDSSPQSRSGGERIPSRQRRRKTRGPPDNACDAVAARGRPDRRNSNAAMGNPTVLRQADRASPTRL